VVGTDTGQTGVAPGALDRTWTDGGRTMFHYTTDGPIGDEWAFASAEYAVHEAMWNDVAIRILHHPGHTGHVERAVRAIRASLVYYTEHFGPYRYRHITVLEVPGDGVGMHAEASMLTHGEGVTLMNPDGEDRGLDMPFFIVAHEMGHQWNVPAAFAEGAPVLSESLATYYAMKVVEHTRVDDQLRALTSFLRKPYPIAPVRRGEPLLRALDRYMSYRWGPFALYALSEYIGEKKVNGALRRLFETHEPDDAPLATTLDLFRELQAVTPDSIRYLLHDLFEVNTFWVLATERVRAEPTPSGDWRVALDVRARKMVYDSAGVETEVPMDEWVQAGVFGARQPGRGELSAPLHLEMHRIRSGDQTITITVRGKPVLAGIDPYHLLDWEEKEDDDNIEAVTIAIDATKP
jgi:aminopeptidase N